jgi:hypothetical protein
MPEAEVEELQRRFGDLTVNAGPGSNVTVIFTLEPGQSHAVPSVATDPGQLTTPSAGLAASPPAQQESTPLSQERRTAINRGIGQWVTRALAGHRGSCSGRAENPLRSKVWLVFKDFRGNVFNPVKVCISWALACELVKEGNEFGDSVFIGVPSQRDAQEVVDAAGKQWPLVDSFK